MLPDAVGQAEQCPAQFGVAHQAGDPDRALQQQRREVGHRPGEPGVRVVLRAEQVDPHARRMHRQGRVVLLERPPGDACPVGQFVQYLTDPAQRGVRRPAADQILYHDRRHQEAEVVGLGPVGGTPRDVLQRPAAGPEGRDRRPVPLGELPSQAERGRQGLLFLVEQAQDRGAAGEQVGDAVQRFISNPDHPGLNLHPIKAPRSRGLHSFRASDELRVPHEAAHQCSAETFDAYPEQGGAEHRGRHDVALPADVEHDAYADEVNQGGQRHETFRRHRSALAKCFEGS